MQLWTGIVSWLNKYMLWKKVKTWNHKGHCASFSCSVFLQKQPPKIALEGCCSKILQKDTQLVSDLVADHRPSYLNFEADISLEYLELITGFVISCFIYYHFSNSYRIITSCSALFTR